MRKFAFAALLALPFCVLTHAQARADSYCSFGFRLTFFCDKGVINNGPCYDYSAAFMGAPGGGPMGMPFAPGPMDASMAAGAGNGYESIPAPTPSTSKYTPAGFMGNGYGIQPVGYFGGGYGYGSEPYAPAAWYWYGN